MAAGSVAAVLCALALAPPLASAESPHHTRVTLAFLPSGTGPERLARIEGIAPGLLSAGLGSDVPAAQTYLDIGQGNRVSESLYDEPLPRLFTIGGRVPPVPWRAAVERARGAPAEIEPGLLASALERTGGGLTAAARAKARAGPPALSAVDRRGRVRDVVGCPVAGCPGMTVTSVAPGRLPSLGRRLRGDDLLIAIERPPPEEKGEQLSVGIAGRGFDGQLTSDSTRLDGMVLSTDLAPTILERLGIEVPAAMNGSPIRAAGEADPRRLVSLEKRMAEIRPRRGPVIGANLLIWAALAGLVVAALGARGARLALSVLPIAGMYLPAVLLVGAALEPSQTVERLLVGVGCPLLAALTLTVLRGYAAVALACAVTVLAYAADVVAGSPLTPLSLIGPNPGLGVRFFGIGNELEATVATLLPIGVGAGLVAWSSAGDRRAPSPPAAAAAFAVAAVIGVAAFAPGRFGADVGAAIVLPIGAAVAAWFVLGGGRGRVLLLLALPLAALAALLGVDLVLGGDAHLSRSVLQAGGLNEVADVIERRLRLSAESFGRNIGKPSMLVCIALIVTGLAMRRRIRAWFDGRRPAFAGFLGAVAATVAGILANDSGALLLIIGTSYASLFVAFAWARSASVPASVRPPLPAEGAVKGSLDAQTRTGDRI